MDYIEIASAHIADRYPLIVYSKPRLMDLPSGAILGTWTYSVPGKVRFILNKEKEVAPGVMPSDLARAWIRDAYKLPIRRKKEQLVRGYAVPIFAKVGKYGDHSYVDIRHAYLQILKLGYDVEYLAGKYIGAVQREVPQQIADNKLSYAIAVTISGTIQSNIEIMGRESVYHHRPMNLYSNPCLYNLANDTLCAIGSELLTVLAGHIVYLNTDGAIVESGYEQYAFDIISSWGFESRVSVRNGVTLQGATEVAGVGSFKIGGYKTRRFDPYAQDYVSDLMPRNERAWLKLRWQKWAKRLT